jgi:hypothetical protein
MRQSASRHLARGAVCGAIAAMMISLACSNPSAPQDGGTDGATVDTSGPITCGPLTCSSGQYCLDTCLANVFYCGLPDDAGVCEQFYELGPATDCMFGPGLNDAGDAGACVTQRTYKCVDAPPSTCNGGNPPAGDGRNVICCQG